MFLNRQTKLTRVKRQRARGTKVEITTIHPNRTFMAEESCLKSPHSFRMAMHKLARTIPTGVVFGETEMLQTKGEIAKMWQQFLDGAK